MGVGSLIFSGGTLAGSGVVTPSGTSTWSGGTFAGNIAISSGSTLNINGGGKIWTTGVLTSDGVVNWSAGNIDILGNGSLSNTGTFNILGGLTAGDISAVPNSPGTTLSFVNSGALNVNPGTGNTVRLGSWADSQGLRTRMTWPAEYANEVDPSKYSFTLMDL
jgi:hypothetical protein